MQSPVETALTLAELGIKPGAAVEFSQSGPVSILAEGAAVAYLLSAEHYEMLRDALGKAELSELLLHPPLTKGKKPAPAAEAAAHPEVCAGCAKLEGNGQAHG